MAEHTDAERLDFIENILQRAPKQKSIERMTDHKIISFRIESDQYGWPTLRQTLDKQIDNHVRGK